jgi:hypothetical protein
MTHSYRPGGDLSVLLRVCPTTSAHRATRIARRFKMLVSVDAVL